MISWAMHQLIIRKTLSYCLSFQRKFVLRCFGLRIGSIILLISPFFEVLNWIFLVTILLSVRLLHYYLLLSRRFRLVVWAIFHFTYLRQWENLLSCNLQGIIFLRLQSLYECSEPCCLLGNPAVLCCRSRLYNYYDFGLVSPPDWSGLFSVVDLGASYSQSLPFNSIYFCGGLCNLFFLFFWINFKFWYYYNLLIGLQIVYLQAWFGWPWCRLSFPV